MQICDSHLFNELLIILLLVTASATERVSQVWYCGILVVSHLTVQLPDSAEPHLTVQFCHESSPKIDIPYILESNAHPFYSFSGLKNQMRIRIACGLDSRSRAGFWKFYLLFYLLLILFIILCNILYNIYNLLFLRLAVITHNWIIRHPVTTSHTAR